MRFNGPISRLNAEPTGWRKRKIFGSHSP
eukprot:COSAG06_NODE_73898_length_150_cov_897.509804_1_plen_28_part_01